MKVNVKESVVTLTVYSFKIWLLSEKLFKRTKSSVRTVIEAEVKFHVVFLIGEKWRRIQCRPGDVILNRYEAKPKKTQAVWYMEMLLELELELVDAATEEFPVLRRRDSGTKVLPWKVMFCDEPQEIR